MKKSLRSILVDFERLKYPYTGLFSFSKSLGKALIKVKQDEEDLTFFVPKTFLNDFGSTVQYLRQSSIQKFIFPGASKFEIWHSTYQGSDYYPRNKSVKIIQTVHDLNFLYEKQDQIQKVKSSLKKIQAGIDRSEVITTISHFTMQELEKNLNLGSREKRVIYNGCEVKLFPDFNSPIYLPQKPFLFSLGTVLPKKNFHTLPALLAGNDFELIIAGIKNHPYQDQVLKNAKKFGVESRVKLLGPVDEENKYWYYKNCRAFVFPSLAEGFGLPAAEAMHFGKPLFLSKQTSLPEIGGKDAFYFDSFEPESMQKALEEGLNRFNINEDPAKLISRAEQFTWEKAAKSYMELYRI